MQSTLLTCACYTAADMQVQMKLTLTRGWTPSRRAKGQLHMAKADKIKHLNKVPAHSHKARRNKASCLRLLCVRRVLLLAHAAPCNMYGSLWQMKARAEALLVTLADLLTSIFIVSCCYIPHMLCSCAGAKYDFTGEQVHFESGPHKGDVAVNVALGATLLWLPLTAAAVGRGAFVKYRFTDKRISVITNAPWKKEQLDAAYQEVDDVVSVGRGLGLWGDMVVTLKNGDKIEMRSLPKYGKDCLQQVTVACMASCLHFDSMLVFCMCLALVSVAILPHQPDAQPEYAGCHTYTTDYAYC